MLSLNLPAGPITHEGGADFCVEVFRANIRITSVPPPKLVPADVAATRLAAWHPRAEPRPKTPLRERVLNWMHFT